MQSSPCFEPRSVEVSQYEEDMCFVGVIISVLNQMLLHRSHQTRGKISIVSLYNPFNLRNDLERIFLHSEDR